MSLIGGEFIDVIEWLEESPDAMVWKFDRPSTEIMNGAQLIVRPGQVARDVLVWTDGMAQWAPASQVPTVHILFDANP